MKETRITDIENEIDWKGYADDYLSGDPNRLQQHLPDWLDGREPKAIEHLCAKDLQVHDGPVEDCCVNEWRDHRCEP